VISVRSSVLGYGYWFFLSAALDGFRAGSFKVLIATDTAARGVDVLDISHVVNYDMPDSTDAYTHRIGRTGQVGKAGDAFTLVTSEDAAMVHALCTLLSVFSTCHWSTGRCKALITKRPRLIMKNPLSAPIRTAHSTKWVNW